MKNFKGQSSIEFVSVIAITALLASPFIIQAQESAVETRSSSGLAQFDSSLDEFVNTLERVDAMGGFARDSVRISVPSNIVETYVKPNAIVYTRNTSSGLINYTRITDATINQGDLPVEEGNQRIQVEAVESGVNFSSDTLEAYFVAKDTLIVNNTVEFESRSETVGTRISNYEWRINGTVESQGSNQETFTYNFTNTEDYNVTLKIESADGLDDQLSRIYTPSENTSISQIFGIQTQSEWNKGYFNLTSADRNNNSGNLGLGYLNGSNPSASSFEEGLVGYWRMDRAVSGSGGTVRDYSGEANDGVTNGGVSTGVNGIFESDSMSFTSGEDIDVQSDSTLEGMDSLALSAWIKPNSLGKDYFVLGGKNLYEIVLDDGSNRCNSGQNLWWAVENGDGDWTINCEDITIPTNSWTHVALVSDFSSDEIRIYKNGQLEVTNSGTGSVSSNGNPIGIAQRPDGFGSFDGKIDEARIYDRSLSSSEIKDLYLRGEPFKGNYTSKNIENSDTQNWKELEIQASINSTTDKLTATFETLKSSFTYYSEQIYNSVEDWNTGDFNKTTADELIDFNYSSELEASNQQGFNEGSFNGTSADRKDNSGDLGLGYRNGSVGDDLIGYWRMDRDIAGDEGTVKDYSGKEKKGITVGGVNSGNDGVLSTKAFGFSGGDEAVDLTGNYTQDFEGLTISGWIKHPSTSDYEAIIEREKWEFQDGFGLYLNPSGTVQWGGSGTGNDDASTSTSSIKDDEWHFVAARFRDFNSTHYVFEVYVDGSSVEDQAFVTTKINQSTDADMGIGARLNDGSNRFNNNGVIDEFRIYNRSLSSNEVEELYFNGRPFQGNYTAEKIDNGEETIWGGLEVNASIPSDTSVNATFKALDTNGDLVDSQRIDLDDGLQNYGLSVSSSEDAEVVINGSSSNVTKSWEIHGLEVFSSEVVDKIEGLRIGYRNGSAGNDLFSYLRFDSPTPVDYSGEDRNGIKSGSGISGYEGVFDTESYRFDGNNYVNISSVPQQSGSNITISVWVKKTGSGFYNNKGVSGKWGSTNSYTMWTSADNSDFKPQFSVETTNGRTDAKFNSVLPSGWHHLVGTYGDSAKIYIDGELKDTGASVGGSIQDSTETLTVGSYTDETGKFTIKAYIDEIGSTIRPLTNLKLKIYTSMVGLSKVIIRLKK
jgi:hypothetical protein